MTKAASVAEQAGTELGSGAFGQALKRAWRPAETLRQSFEEIQQFHQDQAKILGDAVETSYGHYRPHFAGALTGEAGDALLTAHDAACRTWSDHQDKHTAAATAAARALGHIKGLQGRIDTLAEAGEEEFNIAVRKRDPIAAMHVWTRYNEHAKESTSEAVGKATTAIKEANFTVPLDVSKQPPGKDGSRSEGDQSNKDSDGQRTKDKGSAANSGDDARTGDLGKDGARTGDLGKDAKGTPDTAQQATPAANTAAAAPDSTRTSDALTRAGQMPMGMPIGGASGGGQGGGSGGSGMSGLGSAFKPSSSMGSASSMPTAPASSMPTAPASSMPSTPSVSSSSSAASPMSNPGSSFQSGLASGMSAAGGGNSLAPSPTSQQMPQQALAAHQAVAGAPAFGSGPAGVPLSAPGGDEGVGGAPGGSSSGGGAAQAGGSAPMMPPAAAMGGGAPMAPYSAPGAGAAGAPGGGGSATGPAASSGQSATAGAAAPGPVMAGGSEATVSAPGVAAMATEVNPDLLLAQRVLGGLVRGCEDWRAPIAWAVGVVKTAVGSQVVIASSLGGGAYVPSTVFLPSTARLAVADPALPFGMTTKWMGCTKPSKILVDHFEQLSRRVAGAEFSAMVTTELWPQEPAGVSDFLGVQHRQALGMVSVAPTLDVAHQHRLTALDPGLAQRVSSIGSIGGDVSVYAAAQLTAAVMQAAGQPDGTGKRLATVREGNILASVQRGTADDVSWALYDKLVHDEYGDDHQSPDSYAPLDFDGSDLHHSAVLWYRHFFHVGRVVELVHLWKSGVPPLAEVAYCGVQAGFGSVVTTMVSALENEIRGHRGGTPSS
jgi:hypothetical protein